MYKTKTFIIYYFRVKIGQENFWAERCSQDRLGAQRCGLDSNFQQNTYMFRVRFGEDTFWTERCGQDRQGGRALRPHVLHLRPHQRPVSTQASHRYYFSGSTKFIPPLSVLEFSGTLHTTGIPLCLFSWLIWSLRDSKRIIIYIMLTQRV